MGSNLTLVTAPILNQFVVARTVLALLLRLKNVPSLHAHVSVYIADIVEFILEVSKENFKL